MLNINGNQQHISRFESVFFKTNNMIEINVYNYIFGQYLEINTKTKCKPRTRKPFWNNELKLLWQLYRAVLLA